MIQKDITLVNFFPRFNNTHHLPIGSIALIAALLQNGFRIDFRDFQLARFRKNPSEQRILGFLKGSSDIIGLSCFSFALPGAICIAKKIKEQAPHKRIILGGVGPTLVARQLLGAFFWIDTIVLGDGFVTLPKLLRLMKQGKGIDDLPGVAYRKNGRIVIREVCHHREILTQSMIPALKHIDLKMYHNIPVLAARGCLYRCSFCCVGALYPQYEFRDIEILKEELLFLSRHCRSVTFLDEAFLANRDRVHALFRFIRKKRLNQRMTFGCFGRIDLMKKGLARELSRHGFHGLYFGLEAGSNRILSSIHKGFTIEQAVRVLLETKQYIKEVYASFICGYPFETKRDFFETILHNRFLAARKIRTQLHLLCPLPNTSLFNQYKHELRFSHYHSDLSPHVPFMKDYIVKIVRKYPHVFPTFYHYKSEGFRCVEKFKQVHGSSCAA